MRCPFDCNTPLPQPSVEQETPGRSAKVGLGFSCLSFARMSELRSYLPLPVGLSAMRTGPRLASQQPRPPLTPRMRGFTHRYTTSVAGSPAHTSASAQELSSPIALDYGPSVGHSCDSPFRSLRYSRLLAEPASRSQIEWTTC